MARLSVHEQSHPSRLNVPGRGRLHAAVGRAVGSYDAQDFKPVPVILAYLPHHLLHKRRQAAVRVRLLHFCADARVLLKNVSLPARLVAAVKPQAAQLRARHLDYADLALEQRIRELFKGRRPDRRAVGYGVLIQKAVRYEYHFFTSSVFKQSFHPGFHCALIIPQPAPCAKPRPRMCDTPPTAARGSRAKLIKKTKICIVMRGVFRSFPYNCSRQVIYNARGEGFGRMVAIVPENCVTEPVRSCCRNKDKCRNRTVGAPPHITAQTL